jgi:hypothetical protein
MAAVPTHHQSVAIVLDFVDAERAGRWPRRLRRLARGFALIAIEWLHFASLRSAEEFGRYRSIADMAGFAGGPTPSRM